MPGVCVTETSFAASFGLEVGNSPSSTSGATVGCLTLSELVDVWPLLVFYVDSEKEDIFEPI